MDTQLQCPVCTLFLHVGMDLQSHLDTHPKDQVIKALVNITLTKQPSDPNSASTNLQQSKYAPIAENAFTQEVNPFLPEPIPRRPQQVLFGYSCSTRVFREVPNQQSTTTQKFVTNALPANHIVPTIATQASFAGQQSQKFPPPPYGSIVSKRAIEPPSVQALSSTNAYKLTSHQVGISSQRNGTLYLPVENVDDEVETVSEEHIDDYTTQQADQNIEYIEHSDEYLEDDAENQEDCPTYENENLDPLQDNRIIRPNSVIYINDDEPIDVQPDAQNQKKFTEGLRVLSDVKLPAPVDITNLDCKFGESFKLDDVLCTRLQTDSDPIELDENTDDEPVVVGDSNSEFEMLDSVVDAKVKFDTAIKCEINVAKTIKSEFEGDKQPYQNADEVSDIFYNTVALLTFTQFFLFFNLFVYLFAKTSQSSC